MTLSVKITIVRDNFLQILIFLACTIDSCDPELGCVHVDVECMDEITCTFDYCDPELGCLHIVNDTMCDDSKECTHDACNMKFGHCVNIPDDSLCNDK